MLYKFIHNNKEIKIYHNHVKVNGEKILSLPNSCLYSRKIFLLSDLVIKIGEQSILEHDFWSKVNRGDIKYFVPLLYNPPKIISIQERIYDNEFEPRWPGLFTYLEKKYGLIDLNDRRNWAVVNCGDVKIFDYGCFE